MISNRFIAETLSGAVEELEKERTKRHEQQKKCRERACRATMRQIAKAYGISEEDFEELGGMDRGLMKRVRELSERRAETACIKGAVGPQMDRWGVAAAAMGDSEAVAYRESVWIHHSLAYPVYFANVPSVGVVGASNVEALVRRIRYLRWKLNLAASGDDSNASGDSE